MTRGKPRALTKTVLKTVGFSLQLGIDQIKRTAHTSLGAGTPAATSPRAESTALKPPAAPMSTSVIAISSYYEEDCVSCRSARSCTVHTAQSTRSGGGGGGLACCSSCACLDCWTPVLRCLAGAKSGPLASTPATVFVHTCRARRHVRPRTQNLGTVV